MELVSVVMPVYNAEAFLNQAIESILNQTYTALEFIILNDGSVDSSSEIIKSFNDPRIRYFEYSINRGYAAMLNIGLAEAKGIYLARMDADDIAHPDRLNRQVTFLNNNPHHILCGTNYKIIGQEESSLLPLENEDIKLKLLYITPFCHPTVMLRVDVLKEHELFYNEKKIPAEDHDFWVRLSEHGFFHNIPEPLLMYRIHGNNISLKERTEFQKQQLILSQKEYISKFFKPLDLSIEEIDLLHQLFFKENNFTASNLEAIGNLIWRLKMADNFYRIPKDTVSQLLNERFFYRCTTSTYLGLKAYRLANQFGVGISRVMKAKLFLKSLFQYRPK